ncbi:DUF4279 domain-containing protein [Beijerinckia sp. L45]|uniref:DUF4279 domain-containing protein n=1 Tax=Beijerinckia sp. L45 TaxID=1641855 RepID=UPI00131D5762|nr:DUF4279 domain-containing protein [Beijerinckia sp. L45]
MIDASVILWGDHLDPDLVSDTIGIKPTNAIRMGEESRGRVAKTGRWSYDTRDDVRSDSLIDHLNPFLPRLVANAEKLKNELGVEKVRVTIIVECFDETWEEELDDNIVRGLAAIGASFWMTVFSQKPEL